MLVMLLIISQIISMSETRNVHLFNFIVPQSEILLDCISNKVETGRKSIAPSSSFRFSFIPTEQSTSINCHIWWKSNTYGFILYQVFQEEISKYEENCWVIKNSGPCLCECYNKNCQNNPKCFNWNPK